MFEEKITINVVGNGPYSISPSSLKRDWMTETYNSHAYRCLPLTSANTHGWTVNLEEDCLVEWNGNNESNSVKIISGPGEENVAGGYVTFRLPYVFSTPKEYYLWCSGQPNYTREDMSPMNAIVRTDWYPSTFQFTWKLNKTGKILFEKGMPLMFFMPYPKNLIDNVEIQMYDIEINKIKKGKTVMYSEYIQRSMTRIKNSSNPWKEWMGLYRKGQYFEDSKKEIEDPLWTPKPSHPIKNGKKNEKN